jgi:hypothetical protein
MSETTLNNNKPGGDIFSAIEHIILTFRESCQNKKIKKRAFLFVFGYGQT